IKGANKERLPGAVVRVLAKRKSAETASALLRFLPYAGDDQTEEEIWYALDEMAASQSATYKTLATALADQLPAQRAVAACILGRRGSGGQKAQVRKLLVDKDPLVRLRAAQGLLAGDDASGIPALLALFESSSIEVAWQAEELLRWVCGDDEPRPTIGAGTAD